jgi:hypothetical protein
MLVEDRLLGHLRALADNPAWKVQELPEQITEEVLRCLSDRGWIELQIWQSTERGGAKEVTRRFSPSRSPEYIGDWDAVLRKYWHGQGKMANLFCKLYVSEQGRARLADVALGKPEPRWTGRMRRIGSFLVDHLAAIITGLLVLLLAAWLDLG